ncbi:MAG TPA: flagellar filament capping protein FliD [Solirubrobacteraceae bacterium]|nr:flagellar filament capping protein FliD [Solirubrobacteraceae bacterium]
MSSSSTGVITGTSITTSGGLTSGSTLTNSGAGGQLQLTGLASGINTNELIQAELAVKELPLTNMQDSITAITHENSTLTNIQGGIETASLDALDLGEPSLFFQSQTVSSSDSSLVTATATQNIGAVIGSTTLSVARLASASQATFSYTGPSGAADTLTIGNDQGTQTVNVKAGETNAQIASDINGASGGVAYATVLSTGQLVISSRSTGDGSTTGTGDGNPITLSSSTQGSIAASSSQAGEDAEVYVDGSTTASYSQTDTLTDAVPGVTLNLLGVTPTNSPVTITTSAPAPDTDSIIAAVQQFVTDYNTMVDGVNGAINTAPTSESTPSDASPYTGSLFGDPQMENLLSNLRNSVDASDKTLATGYQSLADLGISTGTSTGSASASSTEGLLTVDTATLTAAIEANPSAVQAALQSWSTQFQTTANQSGGAFGSIASRITGNNTEITDLQSQLTTQTEMYNNEESALEQQWASVEASLETLDNQKTSLSTFATGLTAAASDASS